MTDMAEHDALEERFAALATRASGDWPDVRRRARRMRLRTAALVLSTCLVAVVVAAPAVGLHRGVVDWFQTEPASDETQLEFLRFGVLVSSRMNRPEVIPNSAREVTTVQLSSGPTTLAVAPMKSGGFCWRWSGRGPGAGCVSERTVVDLRMPGVNAYALGVSGVFEGSQQGLPLVVSGNLLETDIERLVLEHEDGGSVELPVVWVSAPIDAGFYLYEIPERNRVRARRAVALAGYDREGKLVARYPFQFPAPEDVERSVRLGGEWVTLPVNALVEKARKIIDVPSADGKRRMMAWVVPRADGRRCYLVYNSGGCPPAGLDKTHPIPGLHGGGNRVVVAGRVGDDVARNRLRYEDGAVELVEPIEGFVIYEIPAGRYPRGKRLHTIEALNADGKLLARERFETDSPGLYPCEKPVDQGHGVMACP